jgi:pyruvate,water dikinase
LVITLNKLVKNCYLDYYNEILPSYLDKINKLKNKDLKRLSEEDLFKEIDQIIKNWTCVTLKDHIRSEICFGITSALLESMVGEKQTLILLSGIEGNKLLETNFQLWKLAGQAPPQIADIIIRNEPGQSFTILEKSEGGQDYLEGVQRFLQEYGHRTSDEFELATPRWHEEPGKVLVMIRHYLQAKKANPIEHFETQKAKQAERVQEILGEYSGGVYRLFPFIKRMFLKSLKYSQIYSAMRETTKFYHLMEYAQLRRFLVELGVRFSKSENSGLKDKNDIFYLLPAELPLVLNRELNGTQVQQIISARKMEYKTNLSIQLPPVIFYDSLTRIGDPPAIISSGVFNGTPVSGGRVSGKVRIILNPDDFGKFEEGEILVAPRTDVGWTPLFFIAKALVMDTGNVLSHGAIIAREYGLPAIVNVKDASKILMDGQEIFVDGNEGNVYLSRVGE